MASAALSARTASAADDWGRFKAFQLGRLGGLLSIILALVIIDRVASTTADIQFIIAVVAVDLVLTIPYYLIARRSRNALRSHYLLIMLVDATFLTLGEYFLGGENAVYGLPIYMSLTVMAAVLHSRRGAYMVAGYGACLYAIMVVSTELGWVPERSGPFPFKFSEGWAWTTTLVLATATVTIAAVAGSLSETTRRALDTSHRLERELSILNEDLEKRVEAAVAALQESNHELTRRHEQVVENSHRVDLFARAASHDLRNPITAAAEALRLLGDSDSDLERDELVELSRDNLSRADRMLIGLRDLMRLSGTGSESELQAVQVDDLLEDLLEEISVAHHGRTLPVDKKGSFPPVTASPDQLSHVFRNLINNAIVHNEAVEDLRIEIEQSEDDSQVLFTVRDNGVGIAPDSRELVLSPFRTGAAQGDSHLGLGLALVDAIITRASGKVWIEETPGGGATIRFSLPQQ